MRNDLLHYELLLQDGETPLDIAKENEVIQALEKQQMKVHESINNDYNL